MFTIAMIGSGEVIIVLVLALLLFGPQKLPEIARQVGTALREIQKMSNSVQNDVHNAFQLDSYHDYTPSSNYRALPTTYEETPAEFAEEAHPEHEEHDEHHDAHEEGGAAKVDDARPTGEEHQT